MVVIKPSSEHNDKETYFPFSIKCLDKEAYLIRYLACNGIVYMRIAIKHSQGLFPSSISLPSKQTYSSACHIGRSPLDVEKKNSMKKVYQMNVFMPCAEGPSFYWTGGSSYNCTTFLLSYSFHFDRMREKLITYKESSYRAVCLNVHNCCLCVPKLTNVINSLVPLAISIF